MLRTALTGAALVPLVVVALAGCDEADQKYEAAAKAPCGPLPTASSDATLPTGFPLLPGQVLHDQAMQGKTTVVYGLVAGSAAELPKTRDAVAALLTNKGYTIDGKDQEKNKEADADFSGPIEGNISVHPRCQGYQDIKYTINGS